MNWAERTGPMEKKNLATDWVNVPGICLISIKLIMIFFMPARWLALRLSSKRVKGLNLTWPTEDFLCGAGMFCPCWCPNSNLPWNFHSTNYKHGIEPPQQSAEIMGCPLCFCGSVNFVHCHLILVFNCPYCCICSYTDSCHVYSQLFLRYSCGTFSSHCSSMHWSPLMLTPGWEDRSDNMLWVSSLFHGWIVWIPSNTAPSFVNHQVKKKKSRSLTIVALNCLSLYLVGWGPF